VCSSDLEYKITLSLIVQKPIRPNPICVVS
jgi:hypothetical protein